MSDGLVSDFAASGKERFASRQGILWIWRSAGLVALLVLCLAFYWTVRFERADWLYLKGSRQSIQEAIRLAPGNPEYYGGWAQVEPDRAVEVLEKAVALNPLDSSLRIQLGLAAEERGDFRKAEASLIEATRLNTGFAPRWMLSDFYLHRGDAGKFWPVVKAALTVSYGDVSALFRNCWTLSSDPQTIFATGIPDRASVLRQYLSFLLNEGRLDAAEPVANKVLAHADKDALGALLNYCDYLLEAGRGEQALGVWNGLSERKLIPYAALAPGGREVPVNGDFRLPGLGAGFDWRVSSPDGIELVRAGNPPALLLTFSGKQPENAEILRQYVLLLPRRQYVLSVRYRVAGIATESGLMCYLLAAQDRDLLNGKGLLPGGIEGETERDIPFQTPDKTTLARLVFGYQRMLGTMRTEGSLTLRKFLLFLSPEDRR
jgi:tetratricopeptide (TPR) repeat protein